MSYAREIVKVKFTMDELFILREVFINLNNEMANDKTTQDNMIARVPVESIKDIILTAIAKADSAADARAYADDMKGKP